MVSPTPKRGLGMFLLGAAFAIVAVFLLIAIWLFKIIYLDKNSDKAAPPPAKTPAPQAQQPVPAAPAPKIPVPQVPQTQNVPAPLPPGFTGKPDPLAQGMMDPASQPKWFRQLPKQHSNKLSFVHHETYQPLMNMILAAQKDGIKLEVVSAFRSFAHQKSIWERKWNQFSGNDAEKAFKILRYSSFPGTSRHHWGTDIDFNSVNLDYWTSPSGKKTLAWLRQNAPKYGFCEPYSGNRKGGYENEPWHWSYKQTARALQQRQQQAWQLSDGQKIAGAHVVYRMPETVLGYITDISPDCR